MSLRDVKRHAEYAFVEPEKKSDLYKQTVEDIRELYRRGESYDRAVAEALCEINYKIVTEGLTESSGARCTTKLVKGGRCGCGSFDHDRLPGSDHTIMLNKDGKPHVYITQPYDLAYEEMKKIVEHCEEHGLRADIHATSWHFPGWTLCIEVRRATEPHRYVDREVQK